MQKLENKNNQRRLTLISTMLVVLIASGVFAYKTSQAPSASNDTRVEAEDVVDYDRPTDEQINAGIEAKKDSLEEDSSPSSPSSTSVSITSVNQDADFLQVRTTISSLTPGRCTIIITLKNSDIYKDEAETQQLGSYSVCKGFDIPLTGLEKGDWTVQIVYVDSSSGTPATGSRQIEVR